MADRFRYFVGGSGRRYLFTAVDVAEFGDFASGILLLARPSEDGVEARLVVPFGGGGEPAASVCRKAIGRSGPDRAYVHLLAETPGERRAVVFDLCPNLERLAA